MRQLCVALAAATVLSTSFLPHPAKATMPLAPAAIQAALKITSPTMSVACAMRKVCSRKTARCTMREVCNTPSRSRPIVH